MREMPTSKGPLGLAIVAQEVYGDHLTYSFFDSFNLMEHSSLLLDLDSIFYSNDRIYGDSSRVTVDHLERIKSVAARKHAEIQAFLEAGRTVFVVVSPVPNATFEGLHSRKISVFEGYPWETMRIKTSIGQTSGDIASGQYPSLGNLLAVTKYTYALIGIDGEAVAYATGTKEAICLIQPAYNGRVVYVQKPRVGSRNPSDQHARSAYAVFLNALADELAQNVTAAPLPEWSQSVSTKSLMSIEAERDQINARLRDLSSQLEEINAAASREAIFRYLLAGTGVELEIATKSALTCLGFALLSTKNGNADVLAKHGQNYFAFEVKGLAKSAQLKNCRQATQWVQDAEALVNSDDENGEIAVKGVLIVVAFRETPLEHRQQDIFPSNVVDYAQKRNLCLISGEQLLFAWLSTKANPSLAPEFVEAIRQTSGVLKFTENPTQVLLIKSR